MEVLMTSLGKGAVVTKSLLSLYSTEVNRVLPFPTCPSSTEDEVTSALSGISCEAIESTKSSLGVLGGWCQDPLNSKSESAQFFIETAAVFAQN
jgi:hypothetical protein